jgi:bifunctional UDP-N-acetylglucosamine pyrophosphorylase/glucosamine-1-phosphate N-acetyltransferase
VVLAAGLGKRLGSALPKVLHLANGKPLIHHVLQAVLQVEQIGPIVIVVGTGKDQVVGYVREHFPEGMIFVGQPEQLGTGDAVRQTEHALSDHDGTVLVLPGDGPLVTPATIRTLLEAHEKSEAHVTILTARVDDPSGYGRVVRGHEDEFLKVIEEADAGPGEQAIDEVSSGIFCFESRPLFEALREITNDNAQREYYLPDAAFVIGARGGIINAVMGNDSSELRGVNDRIQLAEAQRELRLRKIEKLQTAGVTVEDPLNTYIDEEVEVGPDTTIKPATFLRGSTRIGSGCTIGPSAELADTTVEDGAQVLFTVAREASIGPRCTVGPFAYLRPGARLEAGSKVGTFVEVKASTIGEGSKVPHLSYVGDAEIGKGVNIGAGTVTVNYDGEEEIKSKTVIEDEALIGSDTMLVAPVRVSERGITGAGSVVTRDVGPEEVVKGAPARPFRKRKRKRRDN